LVCQTLLKQHFKNRLGSVCIHVSALLQSAVFSNEVDVGERNVDFNKEVPVTPLPCSWNKPGKGPVIVYNSNIRTINSKVYFRYQVPIGKVADLEVHSHRKKEVNLADISVVSDEEHKRTNELLARVKHQLPIVLSVVPQYAASFTTITENYTLPNLLTDLFNTNFEVRSNKEINEECERIFNGVTISKQEQISVELATREQSGCEEWENKEVVE